MKTNIRQLKSMQEIVHDLSLTLQDLAMQSNKQGRSIYIAIPGGTTPIPLFKHLSEKEMNPLWQNIHIFWSDERCVPPNHPESNYGQAYEILFSKVPIPPNNLHRITGENDPINEAKKYADEIENNFPKNDSGWPVFDWIILGMGTDGHTASIFPDSPEIIDTDSICLVTHHPQTGQKRISLGLGLINQAKRITFLVTGESKSRIVSQIINKEPKARNFPAAKIQPVNGILEWYIDKEASSLLQFK